MSEVDSASQTEINAHLRLHVNTPLRNLYEPCEDTVLLQRLHSALAKELVAAFTMGAEGQVKRGRQWQNETQYLRRLLGRWYPRPVPHQSYCLNLLALVC